MLKNVLAFDFAWLAGLRSAVCLDRILIRAHEQSSVAVGKQLEMPRKDRHREPSRSLVVWAFASRFLGDCDAAGGTLGT